MSQPQVIAHYRVVSKLGEGGMGEVWLARDTKLNRDVAIKVLPEGLRNNTDRMARFTREAQVLASLNHPNIATIHGVEEGALVMELVEGPTLAERISQGAIPLEEALPMAKQMAEAIEYAHEHGVIHRDLKPANVKVSPEGRIKVLDFGLAKAMSTEGQSPSQEDIPTYTVRQTMPGVIMGTPAYMSPEQARGKPVDRRTDIWAFGVILVEMLTGRPLYSGETISEKLAAVIMTEPDLSSLPALPAGVRTLIRRCLTKDAQRRLRDIGEARIALDGSDPGVENAAAPPAAAPPRGAALPWIVAAAVLAVGRDFTRGRSLHRDTGSAPRGALRAWAAREYRLGNSRAPFGPPPGFARWTAHRLQRRHWNRKSRLWLRTLDTLTARLLPGTDGAFGGSGLRTAAP